jgi:hypothetical protein
LVAAAEQQAVVAVQFGDDAEVVGVAVVTAGAAQQQKQIGVEAVEAV